MSRQSASIPDNGPAILHLTHWKAGSTWIDAILQRCVPERVVQAEYRSAHVVEKPIEEGKVYPRVYLTREQVEGLDLPERCEQFVVIRDLRDVFVSAYFSIRFSHDVVQFPKMGDDRERLRGMSFKEGLESVARHWMVKRSASIQMSWAEAGDRLIRYEELLEDDSEILERVLIGECRLEVDPSRFQAAVRRSRFAAMSGGRPRGHEDHNAHQRRGVPGDWRNYLRGSLKESFKRDWGELLIATGYERDLDW